MKRKTWSFLQAGILLLFLTGITPLLTGGMRAEAAVCRYENGYINCSPAYNNGTVPWAVDLYRNSNTGIYPYGYSYRGYPAAYSGVMVIVSDQTTLTVDARSNGSARVTRVMTNKNAVKVPDYVVINGYPYAVTEIGAYAFSASPYLSQVTLPPTVNAIMSAAFSNAAYLSKVTISSSGTLMIKPGAFRRADRLRVIQFLTMPANLKMSIETFLGFDSSKASIKLPISTTDQNLDGMKKRMKHAGFSGKVVRRIH